MFDNLRMLVYLDVFFLSDCALKQIFIKAYFKAPLPQPSTFREKSLIIAFCFTSHVIFRSFMSVKK